MGRKTRLLTILAATLAIALVTILMAASTKAGESGGSQPFEKPQLLNSLEFILRIRFPQEKPAGDWLISSETGEVTRDYTGGYRVFLKPSGEFCVIRDSQKVFGGLWANWERMREKEGKR